MTNRTAIIVVPSDQKVAANAACALIDTDGYATTFRAGLHETGGWPPTHYVCNWTVTQTQWDQLAVQFGGDPNNFNAKMYDGDQITYAAVLTAEGLQPAQPPED